MMTSEATFMVSVATVSSIARSPWIQTEADRIGILYQTFHGGGMYESEIR